MDIFQWIFGFILWETLLEEYKKDENDTHNININIEIGQETPENN